MIPGKKFSDPFWNLVKQCSALCQILTKKHEDVIKSLSKLDCENGYAKESFVAIEFYDFVILAFREDNAGEIAPPDEEALVEFRLNCRRLVDKLKVQVPKPVYFTGHGNAGLTAVFSANQDFVSGVVTFGLPEKLCVDGDIHPHFPLPAVLSFHVEGDTELKPYWSDTFTNRVVLPRNPDYEGKKGTVSRFVGPINKAILEKWTPVEKPPPLDDILSELEAGSGGRPVTNLRNGDEAPPEPLKSPLKVVVYCHSGDEATGEYVDSLRLLFDGVADQNLGYLAGFSGLPGVLRVVSEPPCEIDAQAIGRYFDDSLHTLVVALMDDRLGSEQGHMEWLNVAAEVAGNSQGVHRLLPVGIHERAFDKTADYAAFSKIQRVICSDLGDEVLRSSYTALLAVHQAYQLLGKAVPGDKSKLTLFLSHARKDGLPLADALWQQIKCLPGKLDDNGFYDKQTLQPGLPWDQQLRDHAGNCVMLVLRTNQYETRAWCREEFLTAVRMNVPIMVVDAQGDDSSLYSSDAARGGIRREAVLPFNRYPVTHVRDGNLIRVVGMALTEGLRQLLFERDAHQVCENELAEANACRRFRLNSGIEGLMEICRDLRQENNEWQECRVLYQEPDISDLLKEGYERIVKSFFPFASLDTCTRLQDRLVNKPMETSLAGKVIGISIADVAGKLEKLEANKLTLHAVDRLFSHGATIAFGHDWQEGGIMEAVYDSMRRSVESSGIQKQEKQPRIINLVPRVKESQESKGQQLAKGLDHLKVEFVDLPELKTLQEGTESIHTRTELDKGKFAITLSAMRKQLTGECDARICLGGKMKNATGAMAGILEEAAMAIEKKQPLYLCGHWGGATAELCHLLDPGQSRKPALEDFLPKPEVVEQLEKLAESYELPPGIESAYRTVSEYKIATLSKHNGLSEEENLQLFQCSDIRQVMTLILRGLTKITSK